MTNRQAIFVGQTSNVRIQFLRYLLVGGFAFSINFAVFAILYWNEFLDKGPADAIGFIFGLITNYTLSVYWVFDRRKLKNRSAEFLIFSLIGAVGVFIHVHLLIFFSDLDILQNISFIKEALAIETIEKIEDSLAFCIATGATMVFNFLGRKISLF